MSEIEIACANFTSAYEKFKFVMGSRSKYDTLRDTYKAKKEVSNGKTYRTVRATV